MWTLVSRSTQGGLQKHILKPGKTTLGRGSSADIRIPDLSASRDHCEIEFDPETNSLALRDLGSKNGTFLNGKRVKTPRLLEAEDQIRIGHNVFELLYRDAKASSGEEKSRLQTRPLTKELVLHSIDRHTVLLNEIAEHLNTVSDLDTAIKHVTSLTKKVLAADRCSVIMAKDFGELRKIGFPSSITRPAIEDHLIILIRSTEAEPNLGKTAMLQGVHSALCVPVLIKEDAAAIFYMDKISPSSAPFTEFELELAVGISHQLGLAIQRKDIETKLLTNALYDSLTGLPNQALFINLLNQAVEKAKENPDFSFTVIALDLDDFKVINDFFGYSFGDQLLTLLAQRLKECLRKEDTVARLGGDEFAILIRGVKDEGEAAKVADDLHKALSKPFYLKDRQVNLSAGAGVSLSALGYDRPIDLLRDAETAMYRAKEKGKARIAIFDKRMRDKSIARMNLESRLSQAIENQEFRVKYQPIVSIEGSSIFGFEALVRWQQSQDLQISAADFISLAEKTQFIFDIDMIVLRTACIQLGKWQKQFALDKPFWVSTNLSGRHMADNGFIRNLQQILEDTGLTPNNLNLEFTEKTLMEENEKTMIVLKKLRELGVQVSIDDFGTGYSSLSYLRYFPVDYIKIDRSFIFKEDWEITNLITELAHKLNLKVIAEGVENNEQFAQLQKLNCDFAQGNFFSKAVDAEDVGDMLKNIGKMQTG